MLYFFTDVTGLLVKLGILIFLGDKTNGSVFKDIVVDILKRAHSIGLYVISITSDMGSSNRAMWKSFGIQCSKNAPTVSSCGHPVVTGKKLYFLADVPHIIKNLKAALIRSDLMYDGKPVSVSPIKQLAELDNSSPLKLAPKLKMEHLIPNHFSKMKVSAANHVISNSVAAALNTMVEQGTMPGELTPLAKTTAEFISIFNRWFDLMCSRHRGLALSKYRYSQYQDAVRFLRDVQIKVREMKISDGRWKPLQTGIILTTEAVLQMADELLVNENDFLLTGRLTQDCLESLFSTVRLKTPIPTPIELRNSLKIITISQYMKVAEASSYDQDDSVYLAEWLDGRPTTDEDEELGQIEHIVIAGEPDVTLTDTEKSALYYLTGWAIKAIKTCTNCLNVCSLAAPCSELTDVAGYTVRKEYKEGALRHPALHLFNMVCAAEEQFRHWTPALEELTTPCHVFMMEKVKDQVAEARGKYGHQVCQHDFISLIISKFMKLRIHIFCKEKLKAMNKKTIHLDSKSMAMRDVVKRI